MKTATATEKPAKPKRAASSMKLPDTFLVLKPGQSVVYWTPTTPEKKRAAINRILKNMPPAAKKGEKTAQEWLTEFRSDP